MRTYEEIEKDALPGSAFSNGTEWECWSANWCERCIHDKEFREKAVGTGCPLILVAMGRDKTPVEWMSQEKPGELPRLGDRYHCIEFRDEDDGPSGPPPPPPQCPEQGELFDAEPYEGVRMFADVVAEIKTAGVS